MVNELEKLDANLGGVADMRRQPDAIFIVDLRKEQLAVREAQRLGLPVIALVDTNCDPDEANYVVPGNDDAIRSCALIVRAIADGIAAGRQKASPADFAPQPVEAELAPDEAPTVAAGAPVVTIEEAIVETVASEEPAEEPVVIEEAAVEPAAVASTVEQGESE
jgi:small subunit ribosomal protein S2